MNKLQEAFQQEYLNNGLYYALRCVYRQATADTIKNLEDLPREERRGQAVEAVYQTSDVAFADLRKDAEQ